jgi:penicillin-binding protein 1A
MDAILIKIFATALTLSQVVTHPEAVKTEFDPAQDQAEVVQLMRDGCAHMLKVFNIENLDMDDLISTAMSETRSAASEISEIKAFRGIKFDDLFSAYKQFCKNEQVANSPFDAREVIVFYNKAAANLPDHTKLKGMRLPGTTFVLDAKGQNYAELYEPDSRRVWVPLSDIPVSVQAAFIAAEDKRFYQHKGIDERSVIRAFIGAFGQSGRLQGGSTITQQLAKNLLVGDMFSYERKIREMIVASRMESTLSKPEILELYLNTIFLGRSSWGVEMASRSYFGKWAKDLSIAQGALLAGLTKGPNAYSPDKNPGRARERISYVLNRMQEDGAIDAENMKVALGETTNVISANRVGRDTGYHFVDAVAREAKVVAGIDSLTNATYAVRTTIQPELQLASETALQEGLASYERTSGRSIFYNAEANLAAAVRRLEAKPPAAGPIKPAGQRALENARLPLYDVHWTPATVVDLGRGKVNGTIRVGLRDGTVLPLTVNAAIRHDFKLYDVVFVHVVEATGKDGARAELRVRPSVQGAAVVIDNATGKILAMAGGFSYPLSQLNRVTQSHRQPGSALKPVTYLAALNSGMQPDTLVDDEPITLPPIGSRMHAQAKDYWTPKNYNGSSSGTITLRQALENSRNQVTARLLKGGIAKKPEDSLDRVCALAIEAKIYTQCERYYPFVLGAQPVRPLDLAVFYAAVANEGGRPTPYVIESIEQNGRVAYSHIPQPPVQLTLADRPAFYQLKTMLQGVLARGTANSIRNMSRYVGGKTGTTDEENDAWFVGFSNNVTVAVWVGYDNADSRQRRTLGRGRTGANVAIPIFRPIMQAVWDNYAPQTALRGASSDAQKQLVARPLDLQSGERLTGRNSDAFTEYYRTDQSGQIAEAPLFRAARKDRSANGSPLNDNPFSALFNFLDRGPSYRRSLSQ